jgi:hypothetical protein
VLEVCAIETRLLGRFFLPVIAAPGAHYCALETRQKRERTCAQMRKIKPAHGGTRDAIVHARNPIVVVPAPRVSGGFLRGT